VPHVGRLPLRSMSLVRGADLVIFHSGWTPFSWPLVIACLLSGTPYVVVPHGAYELKAFSRSGMKKRLVAPIERRILRRSAAVHAFFPSEEKNLHTLFGLVPTVISPTGYDPPSAALWKGQGDYLLWIGRFDIFLKGIDMLIEAVALIPEDRRPTVVLHGRPFRGTRADVDKLVFDRHLERWIKVGDEVTGTEKLDLLCGARGYLHVSRWESFGLAIVEALSLGVPTLVTSSCHIASSLKASHAAEICEPTPESISEGLQHLWAEDVSSLSEAGRAFVVNELDWSRSVAHFESQLRDHLAKRSDHLLDD
jgi:glycosyltransferase involved in cell wall biosynthesis